MAPFVRLASFAGLDLITLGKLRGNVVADIFTHINGLLQIKAINRCRPVANLRCLTLRVRIAKCRLTDTWVRFCLFSLKTSMSRYVIND
jgi:hypothetical protein